MPRQNCFNPRPRARGDILKRDKLSPLEKFQSTPPREGRRKQLAKRYRAEAVSIHAPARGATLNTMDFMDGLRSFNPRPRARGDFKYNGFHGWSSQFQSTPPREGRLAVITIKFLKPSYVSIHAPARGATYPPCIIRKHNLRFNPRPRARGDKKESIVDYLMSLVSIHAPARGATGVNIRCANIIA